MVFLFHTEMRFIAVPGKDGGACSAFLYLLVSRFSYSVWDRILCLSVPLGVSFGGKSFPPTCRFVGLTHHHQQEPVLLLLPTFLKETIPQKGQPITTEDSTKIESHPSSAANLKIAKCQPLCHPMSNN